MTIELVMPMVLRRTLTSNGVDENEYSDDRFNKINNERVNERAMNETMKVSSKEPMKNQCCKTHLVN